MKKIFAAILCVLMLTALAACNGGTNPPSPTVPSNISSAGNFYFEVKGIRLTIGADPEAVLDSLGEARNTRVDNSCAEVAVETIYDFINYELSINEPAGGQPYIKSLSLKDDTYPTVEGIYIGSSFEEVTAAYGTDYAENNGFYTYTRATSTMQIQITNGAVSQLVYDYLVV